MYEIDKHEPIADCDCQACAVVERDKLRAEVAELDALRGRLADLLSRTAVALRGPEPTLTRWSWHDLPERAAAAIAAISIVQAAERERCAALCDKARTAIWDYHDKQVRDTAETVCINLAVQIRGA